MVTLEKFIFFFFFFIKFIFIIAKGNQGSKGIFDQDSPKGRQGCETI
jgi:hypothetical protein